MGGDCQDVAESEEEMSRLKGLTDEEKKEHKRLVKQEVNKRWHERNPENRKERQRRYREKNKSRINEYCKSWQIENKERVKLSHAKWVESNRSKLASYATIHRIGLTVSEVGVDIFNAMQKTYELKKMIREIKNGQ